MVWNSSSRLAIAHKNTPAILGKITAIIAEQGINIQDMTNRSRGDYAYTLIDTDTSISEEDIQKIESLANVIKLRVLTK